MLIYPAHSALLATRLRHLGWRPLVEMASGACPAGESPQAEWVAVPALAGQSGSRLTDPGLWQWWGLAQPATWQRSSPPAETRQGRLQRVFAVALGDAFLARAILEQGPRRAPSPGAASVFSPVPFEG